MARFEIVQIFGSKVAFEQPFVELKFRKSVVVIGHVDYQVRNVLIINILKVSDRIFN